MDQENTIRLQKYLAERGIASRRKAVEIITQGHVAVNGKTVTEPGSRIAVGTDTVTIDGKPLAQSAEKRCIIKMYKPAGYICSTTSAQGKSVLELIKGANRRLVPVGRLDKESEGLLLLSNDGDLVYRLTHPKFEHEKKYTATVSGPVTPETVRQLESPITIEGYTTRPAMVRVAGRQGRLTILHFALKEGRNRQIRRLCERSGLHIQRLVRTSIGRMTLHGLKPGEWKYISEADLPV